MTCSCYLYDQDPEAHDKLLRLESMTPVEAVEFVADIIAAEDLGTSSWNLFLDDVDDFGRFVAQHNWQDPAAMFLLGEHVDTAMNAARDHRIATRKRLEKEAKEVMVTATA